MRTVDFGMDRTNADTNVCFSHKADITIVLNHVRFWG